jgi:hypothetical protein
MDQLDWMLRLGREENQWEQGSEGTVFTLYQLANYLWGEPKDWTQRWGNDLYAVRTELLRFRD